jgi:3-oxoacyl-[acyl-carrier protein] reductase
MTKPGMEKGSELAGKVALVTGAARNIGRAIALALAAGGATVAVTTRGSKDQAEAVVKEIRDAGGTAAVFLADVSDGAAVARMTEEVIAKFGRVDILVLNAAIREETHFTDMDYDAWRRVLATDLDSAFFFTRACLPSMRKSGGGVIVTIGGMTALAGSKNRTHVAAAKGGLVSFTKSLAHDLAEFDIRVNCVSPGQIDTLRGPGAPVRPSRVDAIPMKRKGTPEEIAAVVRFVSGPGAGYMTGQTIHVNGGLHMPG